MVLRAARRGVIALVAILAFGVLTACDPPPPACPAGTIVGAWHAEILDGDAACGGQGRIAANVSGNTPNNVSLVIDGQPHVFYAAAPTGGDGSLDVRHAWYTGTGWRYETVDGDAADVGTPTTRTNRSTGEGISVVLWDGRPAVFYEIANTGTLRVARWTGTVWTYQNLTNATTQLGFAGRDLTAVMYGGGPHVFYNDGNDGNDLHHMFWTGSAWAQEDLDGHAALANGAVSRTSSVGIGIRALVMGTQIQLFYDDASATRVGRHGWYTPGAGWRFETLDGDGVGTHAAGGVFTTAAVVYGGTPHVFSNGITGSVLRHAWWTGSTWAHEVLDGDANGAGGRVLGRLSGAIATAVVGTRLDVFSSQSDGQTNAVDYWIRRASYTPGVGWSRTVIDDPAAPRFVNGNPFPPQPQTTGGTRGPASAIAWNGEAHLFVTRVYGIYTGGSTGNVTDGDLRHLWTG